MKLLHIFATKEILGVDNSHDNPTYTPMTLSKEETMDNQMSVLCSLSHFNQS